ncbi:MAG TPA: sigma-70 family RNA polymerase sigma factor [Verrucomicrobiae bacterium]|nr:sigma-70 family RNA polymerase sigma factor [Verrucomicrobiae bacterium]
MELQACAKTEPLEFAATEDTVEETVGEIVSDEAPLAHNGLAQTVIHRQIDTPDDREAERASRQEAARQRRQHRLRSPRRTGQDSMSWYLSEISVVPLLTKKKEIELAKAIETGRTATELIDQGRRSRKLHQTAQAGQEAKDIFIRSNLRLVVSVAKKYRVPPSMELLDLIQEGNLGLEHAVDKFEWRKGFKFSTYATWWIKQAIGRALDQKANLIRLKGTLPGELRGALAAQTQGYDDTTGEQLEGELGLAYRAATPASLSNGNEDEPGLDNLLPSPLKGPEETLIDNADRATQYQSIEEAAHAMNPTQLSAVKLRYLGPEKLSYRAVGEQLGVSPEGARRNVMKGLKIIRQALKDQIQEPETI